MSPSASWLLVENILIVNYIVVTLALHYWEKRRINQATKKHIKDVRLYVFPRKQTLLKGELIL